MRQILFFILTFSNANAGLINTDPAVEAVYGKDDRQFISEITFLVGTKVKVKDGYKISSSAVYECAELIKNKFSEESDFSVIRLKKKVIGRVPLKLRTKGDIQLNDSVFMIGHPLGLPQVLS